MGLEVIAVGLGRTGTTSLKPALEELGFGPCFHMTELMRNPVSWPMWQRACRGEDVDWEAAPYPHVNTSAEFVQMLETGVMPDSWAGKRN